jgi:hypothetical protein
MVESSPIEKEPEYHIYLSGQWERYAAVPYKTIIKDSLPSLKIFDPEEHQEENEGNFFRTDKEAIRNSKYIICYGPPFAMSASTFELGYFYARMEQEGEVDNDLPLRNLIVIWDKDIKPKHGKKWYSKTGFLVETPEAAVEIIKDLEGID